VTFDFNFDFDFDGIVNAEASGQSLVARVALLPGAGISASDAVALGQVLVVQASLSPGAAQVRKRGFFGRWYAPVPTRSVKVYGGLLRVRASLVPGKAVAASTATVAGGVVPIIFELIPGSATGQIVSLIAGRATGDAIAQGSTVARSVAVVTDLNIMHDNVFLLTHDQVNPVVCDNDLLLKEAA